MITLKNALANSIPSVLRNGDATTLLTLLLVLLFGIPSRLVLAPLGGAGSPALLLGLAAAVWWLAHQVSRRDAHHATPQPVRQWMFVLVGAVFASYIAAMVRPIDAVELRAADRGILIICGLFGVLALTCDGIPTYTRLNTLLRRLTFAGGAVAVLGIAQFLTGETFTNLIQIPGLSENGDLTGIGGRDGFARAAGTALHPIEFGIVMAMILPVAIHYAITDVTRSLLRRWFPVAVMALTIAISVSRSAIVCSVVVLAFLLPTWPQSLRRRAYVALVGLLGVVFVGVPGMLGTMLGLFSGIGNDSSALSRTGSYSLAWDFITRAPFFGRGFQTFLPTYRILDNQYLLTAIDTGLVGLIALLGLFGAGILGGIHLRRLTTHEPSRQLSQALAASIAAGAAGFALFDALSFPQVMTLMFVLVGSVGALRHLVVDDGTVNALRSCDSALVRNPNP